MLIGLANNGAGTWNIALNVDLGATTDITSSPAGQQHHWEQVISKVVSATYLNEAETFSADRGPDKRLSLIDGPTV
jgi:hypothetical protein